MQPTLPKIMLDDEDMRETKTGMARSKSADTLASYPSSKSILSSAQGILLTQAGTPGVNEVYGGYPPSLEYHQSPYGNDVGFSSTTRLIDHSGPMGISYPPPVATPPDAAPSFPPRGSSPAPPPGMRPSRSNTQMTGFSSHSGHAPYPPSSLTPSGGSYHGYSNGFDARSPPLPTGDSGYLSQYPSNPCQQAYPFPPTRSASRQADIQIGQRHQGERVLSPSEQSSFSHFRQSGTSDGGLPYDRTDTDIDVDAYSDSRGPAPSYPGSPPRGVTGGKGGYGRR